MKNDWLRDQELQTQTGQRRLEKQALIWFMPGCKIQFAVKYIKSLQEFYGQPKEILTP